MSTAKKNGSDEVAVKVALPQTDDTPTYYVNYAEISHSQYEFALSVVRIPTKLDPERLAAAKKTGTLKLEPTLQVLLPPRLLPGLIAALQTQLKSYEDKFGKVTIQESPRE